MVSREVAAAPLTSREEPHASDVSKIFLDKTSAPVTAQLSCTVTLPATGLLPQQAVCRRLVPRRPLSVAMGLPATFGEILSDEKSPSRAKPARSTKVFTRPTPSSRSQVGDIYRAYLSREGEQTRARGVVVLMRRGGRGRGSGKEGGTRGCRRGPGSAGPRRTQSLSTLRCAQH